MRFLVVVPALSLFVVVNLILLLVGYVTMRQLNERQTQIAPRMRSQRRIMLDKAFSVVIWHNVKFQFLLTTYKMGITPMSDTTSREFASVLNPTPAKPPLVDASLAVGIRTSTRPASIDWRDKNVLNEETWNTEMLYSPPLSTVVLWALEALPALNGGYSDNLSRRQLEECTQGFSIVDMLRYVAANGLLRVEQERFTTRQCGKRKLSFFRAYKNLPASEHYLHHYLKEGPIIAMIHATPNFRHYKSGVFYDPSCRKDMVNYAVLIVGYGTDDDLGDYWLVKTTWGPNFGENGYARIARNRDNHCGIASFALGVSRPVKNFLDKDENAEMWKTFEELRDFYARKKISPVEKKKRKEALFHPLAWSMNYAKGNRRIMEPIQNVISDTCLLNVNSSLIS